MWKTRCKDRHGTNAAEARTAEAEQLKREVIHLYRLKGKVLAEDLHIFYADVKEHIQQDSLALSTWINLNRDLILYSVREAKKKDTNKVRPITTYYKPRRRKPHKKKKPKRTSKPNTSHTTTRPKSKRLKQL